MLVTPYASAPVSEIGRPLRYVKRTGLPDEYAPTGQTLITNPARDWYALATLERGILTALD